MGIQDIQARHDAIGEDAGGTPAMDIGDGWQAHEDREELLAEIHGAAAALAALGVTGEGTLAERILEVAAGAKYAAHYREGTHQMRLSLDAEKIAENTALRVSKRWFARGLREHGMRLSETGTGFPILESTGGANPAEKAEWGKCGVKTEQDANNIGAGIFRFGELVAT